MTSRAEKPSRRGRRSKANASAEKKVMEQLPWKQLQHRGGFTEVATQEQLEMIHNASMTTLEESVLKFSMMNRVD